MMPYVKALQRFLSENAGLAFDPSKLFLAEDQLAPLARSRGHASVEALVAELQMRPDPLLTQAALEAMTTHETFFFRDRMIFEQFRTLMLPKLISERADTKRLRIWCAAGSTGQEAYSLAMVLDDEARKLQGWNVDVLSTDLSCKVTESARQAIYSQFEVQRGLPISYLLRYFRRDGENWQLAEHVKARVGFRQMNLISDFSRLGTFDVILCRNVLMYLDAAARRRVMDRMVPMLASGGYLVLGATETLAGAGAGIKLLPFQGSIGVKAAAIPARPALRLVGQS